MQNNIEESLAQELLEVQRTLGWMDLVIGNISDAVYVVSPEGHIVFANQYFADMLKIPRVFLLGQKLKEVFDAHPTDAPAEYVSHRNESTTGNDLVGIYAWRKNGLKRILKISSRTLATTNETVYLATDITREHELSQMKSSFINLASHQLRTPMTAIMNYSHILRDTQDGKNSTLQTQIADKLVHASERMIQLINDILLITRVQNDGSIASREEVDLPRIISAIVSETKSSAHKKKLHVDVLTPDHLPPLLSNTFAIHEIISNIVVNAIQYTPEKGSITIETAYTDDEVSVSIADTGIGIPEDYIPHMFDQFYRADNAFAVFNEGTGLGLYLVKLLIDQVSGSIECTSELNKGTTFTVKFPYSTI